MIKIYQWNEIPLIRLISCLFILFSVSPVFAQRPHVTLDFDSPKPIDTPARFDNRVISIERNRNSPDPITFNRIASFQDCQFVSDANFSFTIFAEDADFTSAQFCGIGNFANSTFQGLTRFKSMYHGHVDSSASQYLDTLQNLPTVFRNEAIFTAADFKSRTSFNSVIFEKSTYFSFSRFEDMIDFLGAQFYGIADFRLSSFVRRPQFMATQFKENAIFSFSSFTNGANFSYSSFKNSAQFSGLILGDSARLLFFDARLPDLTDFSNNLVLPKDVNFIDANLDSTALYDPHVRRWHYINVAKSDLTRIRIDYLHFRLCFYSSTEPDPDIKVDFMAKTLSIRNEMVHFDRASICKAVYSNKYFADYIRDMFPSADLKDSVITTFLEYCISRKAFPKRLSEDEKISIYERMLKNFDADGQKLSYQILDIEYKDFKNPTFHFGHWWNCYGYHKEWIFYWTLIFIGAFTFITFIWLPVLNRPVSEGGVYYIANIAGNHSLGATWVFFRRIWFSLMYTSAIFFLLGLKIENMNFRKPAIIYIIIIYSLGILCLAYIANFVLQK